MNYLAAKVIAVAAAIAAPAAADVVMGKAEGYVETVEIGEIAFLTEVRSPEGTPCDDPFRKPCAVVSIATEWASRDFPLQIAVVRDRRGYVLQFVTLLTDRAGRSTCMDEIPLRASQSNGRQRLWRELLRQYDRWAASCSTVQLVGPAELRADFLRREADFRRGFARLAAIDARRLGVRDADEVAVGSFLPAKISQSTLDAIAAACGGSGERLRLNPDGSISWDFDGTQPYGADGTRPFDSCVDDQIRYFRGYPERG